jgi:putative thiamine transport system permease protein
MTGTSPAAAPGRPATINWGLVTALGLVGLVFLPVLPGLYWALAPSVDFQVWAALWADPQLPQSLQASLMSSLLGTALAALIAGVLASSHYPSLLWQRLQSRLPPLLALPHAAFAVGLVFLLAPSGWLVRLLAQALSWRSPPAWVTVQDPLGLSLALALAIKESWFLLWVLASLLGELALQRQILTVRSLGYSRVQAWRLVLWPQLLPRLGWPLAAALAYSLSVVDMALILGPGNPPTLAVLAWHWLSDPDPARQAQGGAASLLLLAVFLSVTGGMYGLWRWLIKRRAYPAGRRRPAASRTWAWGGPLLGVGHAVLVVLLIWSLAGSWFFPALWPQTLSLLAWQATDWAPLFTTLWLAASTSAIGLAVVLLWLEWAPKRLGVWLYLPLVLPALPLVAAQYATLVRLQAEGSAAALVWSHLLWVLPYMLLSLVGAYRAFDARLMTSARALGCSRAQACLRVKWPLLLRPILAAWALGFSVSVAQYLPTLFAGAGRFATVTTEAVALSAGGSRQLLALQALLQMALPLAAFALAGVLSRTWGRRHRGLA